MILFFIVIFGFVVPINVHDESWRGLIPLKSSRPDVEDLIGKPKSEISSTIYVYRTEDAEVMVKYTNRETCLNKHLCECHAPDNMVSEIVVRPNEQYSFSSMDTTKWNFERIPNAENAWIMNYFDRSAGILYSVDTRSDMVLYVQYAVPEKDCPRN